MIKRFLISSLLVFFSIALKAQPFNNGWINYSQKYYKIKVAQNGVYRLDSITLANALSSTGISLSTIDPHKFQLFNKGVEQYVYIQGESDGVFNGTDFIEFYAQKNDGSLDSLLYFNTPFLPNPYYSLINDTAVYFLTWNASLSNRRMQSDTATNFNSFATANFFTRDEVQEFHSGYYQGETDADGDTDPRYTSAEGWFDGNNDNDDVILLGTNKQYTVNTPNKFSTGPDPKITMVVIGASRDAAFNLPSSRDHHLTIDYNGVNIVDTSFLGYEGNRFFRYPSINTLGNPANTFNFTSVQDFNFTSNRTVVSYIDIKYPHTYDFSSENSSGFLMYVPNNTGQSKFHLDISNYIANGTVRFYDLSNSKRISVTQIGSNYHALIANSISGTEKRCYLTSDGNIIPVTSLLPVTPLAQFTNFTSLAVDSAYIIVTNKKLRSSVNNYKTYRNSNIYGGLHNVIVADIDELYDQFAYGIVKSPLSIRGFCDFLLHTYHTPPKNLFLIGKSVHMSLARANPAYNYPVTYVTDLVPSFGNPSSDNLLTAGLIGTTYEPAIPTGRLAAQTTRDVDNYLAKVQQFENKGSNPPAEWMKQVLHFGGGNSASEQYTYSSYLNAYKATIQDTSFGANVTSFFKTSSAPIQINTSTALRTLINSGASLMTFFGHASGQGFDESTDDINNYNPIPGHYPFLLANSCSAGDIHNPFYFSTSETFVLTQNKGTIGFLATDGLGYPGALNVYSSQFYLQLAKVSYGKSVGTIIKKTIAADETNNNSLYNIKSYLGMTLHGDPALIINSPSKPDYKITANDLSFDVTSSPDNIIVRATRTNIGRATKDSSFTSLVRTFPNGETSTYLIRNREPNFKDTVSFIMPIDYSRGVGLNKFNVTLDRNNQVAELNESNNSTGDVPFLITGGDIVPVYPYEYAVVNTDTVSLKASTGDPFALAKNYIFQIDTNDSYNNIATNIGQATINAPGGVVRWKPPFHFTDSTVYYWRVAPADTVAGIGYHWREFSFQYIRPTSGTHNALNVTGGWEQAHFFQFKKNTYQYVKFMRPFRRFDFVNDLKHIQCIDGIPPYIDWGAVVYKLNNYVQYVSSWTIPGFTFAVFDPNSGINWLNTAQGNNQGMYGSVTYYPAGHIPPENAFDFNDNTLANQQTMADFINNVVPDSAYVLGYSEAYYPGGSDSISNYSAALRTAFGHIGSSLIPNNQVPLDRPYVIFGKKGRTPGHALKEMVGSSVSSILNLDTTFSTHWNVGYIESPEIGPAKAWHALHWRWHSLDGPTTRDSIFVYVVGTNATTGHVDTLARFSKDSTDVLDLARYVNVTTYPTIRLIAFMWDNLNHTPPQMKRWHVKYDPVPEAAINPPLGFTINGYNTIYRDSIQEGDKLKIRLPVQNVSNISFTADSLLMTYWVVDAAGVTHNLPPKLKKKPFNFYETLFDTITVNTAGYKGKDALWVEVNPVNKPHSQLEQYHFNNIVRIPFYVSGDVTNPLLDVTFDGVHILNNDIVSAKPNILIKLKDENKFLALNDTNDFKVFIQTPTSSLAQRIYFGQYMSFIPAVLPNNSCKINYTPTLLNDGTYLLIVQAKDASNNQSGAIDYKINFEVINKASITEVMNYPNPFTTATHFVFTLTGSEIPSNFKIQIMTITGKVVREIFQDEIGFIHVGRNITDYAWDGKDQYGDRLANGVYLYRVITKLHGEDIDNRETAADQYFKKGWGKMYLMR